MALVRWEPARELSSLQQEMNRLFGSFLDPSAPRGDGGALRRWIPAMDLVEEGDHYVLRADLPGISSEDVNIEVQDDVLTISGERKSEHEQRKEGYVRVERASGHFSRSLTLPQGVDADSIEASFENGVLDLRIPKPVEQKPRRVKIATAARRTEAPVIEAEDHSSTGEPRAGEDHEPQAAGASS